MNLLDGKRMEELFKGCPSCDGGIDDADCSCPGFNEIHALVKHVRALQDEVRSLEEQRDDDYASDEYILNQAGHLSFTAMLADYKHIQEENKKLSSSYRQALESLHLAEEHSDQFARDLKTVQEKLSELDRDGVHHGPAGNNPRHPLDMD